jgi:hypothetical protein
VRTSAALENGWQVPDSKQTNNFWTLQGRCGRNIAAFLVLRRIPADFAQSGIYQS